MYPGRQKLKRRIRLLSTITLLLFVGSLLLWKKRHQIANAIEMRQAERHYGNAERAQANGDTEKALQLASAAYQLDPSNLDVLRSLFLLYLETGSPEVLNAATLLFHHPQASVKDKAQGLGALLEKRDFRLFKETFEFLSQEAKQDPDMRYLEAGYYASLGDAETALRILESETSDDPRRKVLTASIQSIAFDSQVRKKGQADLAELMLTLDPKGARLAFRQIRMIPPRMIDVSILQPAAKAWLRSQKDDELPISDRLIQPTLEYLESGQTNQQIIDETIKTLGKKGPFLVSAWLLDMDAPQKAYELASEGESKQDEDALDQRTRFRDLRLRALAESENWEAHLKLLKDSAELLNPLRLELMLAVATRNLGQISVSRGHWQKAFQLADLNSSGRNAYLDIYDWANRNEEADIAIRAMIAACDHPLGILPSTGELTQLMIHLAETGRDEDLIALSDGLFQREAFSDALVNNAIYLREVTGNLVPGGVEALTFISKKAPHVVGFQTARILALINRDRFIEAHRAATEVIQNHEIDDLPAAESVILAGAFRLAGRRTLLSQNQLEARFENLMPAEREAFEPWFAETPAEEE